MAYKARFTDSALKQLRKLDRQAQRRILSFVEIASSRSKTPVQSVKPSKV